MRIDWKPVESNARVGTLRSGDPFLHNDCLYIRSNEFDRTPNPSMVRIMSPGDGALHWISIDIRVTPARVKVVVDEA
jgi:hypothetical protein